MIKLMDIENAVCQVFEITPDKLKAKGQKRDEFTPRHIAMYAARELTIYSYETIGQYFGGYKHDVVMNAIKTISSNMETDKRLSEAFEEVIETAKKASKKDEFKEAILNDLKVFQKKIGSGNLQHSKLALGQIILNIETLL